MDECKDIPGPEESSREDRPGWFWKPLAVPSSGKKGSVASLGNHGACSAPAHIYGKVGKQDGVGEPHLLLLQLGLGGLCPCILSANSAPFLIHGRCLACVFLPINCCFHYHLGEHP